MPFLNFRRRSAGMPADSDRMAVGPRQGRTGLYI